MNDKMNIQWFPGHMTKARRMITENIKSVDAVCEIVDARIPYSSRNPDLDEMTGDKPRVIVFNKADQADPIATKIWMTHYTSIGSHAIETDSKRGKGVSGFSTAIRAILADKLEYYRSRGQTGRRLRIMVVGIPNVGKSSFINRLANRKAAAASDRPGVTRGKQWITINNELELLDTPGILWPKFDDQTVAENLAFTGAIRDEIMDLETLAANFMIRMRDHYPQRISERYKIDAAAGLSGYAMLESAAKNRGYILSGAEIDLRRMSIVLFDEFRGGKLGRITLEHVNLNYES